MAISNLHILPISIFILFPTTFLGTYIAAVLQGHVVPEFPYISDDATYSPESCVFSQLINIGSVLLCLVIYVRYCEVVQFLEDYSSSPQAEKLNRISLWLGFISSFGLSLVANFQETNVIYVHFAGALLCFGVGTVYFWVQAVLSYHMHPAANSVRMAHWRLGLSIVTSVLFFIILVTGIISHLQFHGDNPRKWGPQDGGWVLHLVSTASEWLVAICFCLYILSFSSEFREITFTHPQSCTPEDDEEDADVEKADEDFEDGRSRLVALTLSLLMAAILQAIRSVGSIVHDVVHTLHWDFDSH